MLPSASLAPEVGSQRHEVFPFSLASSRRLTDVRAEAVKPPPAHAPPVPRRPTASLLVPAALALLALVVRLREPLSSPVIGAEDPYLHMRHAWDLVQGRGFDGTYPPGFAILLAPFALLGPDAFYAVARFLPPLLGVVGVVGVWVLARERWSAPAAAGAAGVAALMPENVFRTNLLFPTALDLALLPFVFLLALRAWEGRRRAVAWLAALLAALLVIHPWVVALLLPTLGLYALATALRQPGRSARVAASVAGGGAALAGALMFLPGTWNPAPAFFDHAGPRLVELVTDPSSLFPLPRHVDLPAMLTWPALLLASAGAAVALARRRPLDLLALCWSAFILPFVLVDWFDVWFIPHRSVAYLSVGVALLAGCAVDALWRARRASRAARWAGAGAAVGLAMVLMAPAAFAVAPWYRLYDEDDRRAWEALRERDAPLVVAASWQAAEGYRAATGGAAMFNPTFFRDPEVRDAMLRDEPGIVVLVDRHAKENDLPMGFLDGWREVGRWGSSVAYERR